MSAPDTLPGRPLEALPARASALWPDRDDPHIMSELAVLLAQLKPHEPKETT